MLLLQVQMPRTQALSLQSLQRFRVHSTLLLPLQLFPLHWPELPLLWLDTEDSEAEVFYVAAADLG